MLEPFRIRGHASRSAPPQCGLSLPGHRSAFGRHASPISSASFRSVVSRPAFDLRASRIPGSARFIPIRRFPATVRPPFIVHSPVRRPFIASRQVAGRCIGKNPIAPACRPFIMLAGHQKATGTRGGRKCADRKKYHHLACVASAPGRQPFSGERKCFGKSGTCFGWAGRNTATSFVRAVSTKETAGVACPSFVTIHHWRQAASGSRETVRIRDRRSDEGTGRFAAHIATAPADDSSWPLPPLIGTSWRSTWPLFLQE